MSAPMVRATLEGRKTQTRRVVKPAPSLKGYRNPQDFKLHPSGALMGASKCPFGPRGDRLWVRETWTLCNCKEGCCPPEDKVAYKADYLKDCHPYGMDKWHPSIHMPRWASRLLLEITDVRVERLQEISEEDAKAEGVSDIIPCPACNGNDDKLMNDGCCVCEHSGRIRIGGELGSLYGYRDGFMGLWNSIYGPGSWELNEWVWVVSFKVVKS